MTAKTEKETTPACRVRAAAHPVRVAGIRFHQVPEVFDAGDLTAEQYATLCADRRVVVEPAEPEPEPKPKGKG